MGHLPQIVPREVVYYILSGTPRSTQKCFWSNLRVCHPFPLKGRMKPRLYKCTQRQPVPGYNRRLFRRRHLGSQSLYRQSRASSSRLKTNKAGEAVLVYPNALYNEGHIYNSFSSVEDPYIAESLQDNAVKVWLYHHHFL